MGLKDDILGQLHIADTAVENAISLALQLPDDEPTIKTPAEFDAAYAVAKAGDHLLCDPSLVYPSPLVLTKDLITITSPGMSTKRATRDEPMPLFQNGITISAAGNYLGRLASAKADLSDILLTPGAHNTLDGVRLLGDPTQGNKRGINADGAVNLSVVRCYIDDIKRKGQDTQAFFASDAPGPFQITDNYFAAAGETILFGGEDDSPASTNVPTGIQINGNDLTKNPNWQAEGWQVKNILELKSARKVKVYQNNLSYTWGGYTQDGYLVLFTPRNQDGGSPFVSVEDVEFYQNQCSNGSAGIQILGTDYLHPSGPCQNINIHDNQFTGLDYVKYTGRGVFVFVSVLQSLPANVRVDSNVFQSVAPDTGSSLYLDGDKTTKAQQLQWTNNKLSATVYGIKGSDSGQDPSNNDPNSLPWTDFVNNGTIGGNVVQ